MYIYTPLCRYWIALYRHVLIFIVPYVDIELEDNKQFISNIPRTSTDKHNALIMIEMILTLVMLNKLRCHTHF